MAVIDQIEMLAEHVQNAIRGLGITVEVEGDMRGAGRDLVERSAVMLQQLYHPSNLSKQVIVAHHQSAVGRHNVLAAMHHSYGLVQRGVAGETARIIALNSG